MFQDDSEDEAVHADERGELIGGVWVRGLPLDPSIDPPSDEDLLVTAPEGLGEADRTFDQGEAAGFGQSGPLADVAAVSAVGRAVQGEVGARRARVGRSLAVVRAVAVAVPLLLILAVVVFSVLV